MGRYDDSIAQYRKALEKNPAFTSSRLGIGNDYIFKRAYDEARRWYQDEFDRATTIDGKISAMGLIAASYVHQGRTSDAVQTCEGWAKLASDAKEMPATAGAQLAAFQSRRAKRRRSSGSIGPFCGGPDARRA